MPKTPCPQKETRKVILNRDQSQRLGITITCGDTYDTLLKGAFIESILPGGPADCDGNLSPRDQILSVNGIDVRNVQYIDVVDLIKESTSPLEIVVAKGPTSATTEPISMMLKSWLSDEKQSSNISSKENAIAEKEHVQGVDILPYTANSYCAPRKNSFYENIEHLKSLDSESFNLTRTYDKNEAKAVDCSIINEHLSSHYNSIPDIIASQIKHVNVQSSDLQTQHFKINTSTHDQQHAKTSFQLSSNLQDSEMSDIYEVMLEKKFGSLGLNIYQGTEPTTSESYIYIHSLIPGGAAECNSLITPGDKLLEVNGVVLQNYSYQEIVNILRESPFSTHLVLERQNLNLLKQSNQNSMSSLPDKCPPVENSKNLTQICGQWNNTEENNFLEEKKFHNSCIVSEEDALEFKSDCHDNQTNLQDLDISHNKDTTNNFSVSLNMPPSSIVNPDVSINGSAFQCMTLMSDNDAIKMNSTNSLIYAINGYSSPYSKANSLHCDKNSRDTHIYRSTPNLADTSDEEESYRKLVGSLYRNKSSDCLSKSTDLEMGLLNMYQDCNLIGGSENCIPANSPKFKKLEDINKFLNNSNTFYVKLMKGSRGLGFSISGGKDYSRKDLFSQLIFIRKLYPLQPAIECGEIFIGDVILAVNSVNMVGRKNTEALEILRSATSNVTLKLFRLSRSGIPSLSVCKNILPLVLDSPSSSASSSLSRKNFSVKEFGEFEITLMKRGGSLGFTVSKNDVHMIDGSPCGIYVKSLIREPAVSDGRLCPGDRIIQVNGTDISAMTHAEAVSFLRSAPESVTLTLFRYDPPFSPLEDNPIHKSLRWEAIELLNDRIKNPNDSTVERKTKLNNKHSNDITKNSNIGTATSLYSSSNSKESTEREVSQGQLFVVENMTDDGPGLQRSQRPKSLDVLNSSDRKHITEDDDGFHRQASVIDTLLNQKPKMDNSNDGQNKKGMKTLLKWRGSTLPNDENSEIAQYEINQTNPDSIIEDQYGELEELSDLSNIFSAEYLNSILSERFNSDVQHRSKPRVVTVDINLDRGWHSRLGFSLCDPPSEEGKTSEEIFLPKAAQVKAVYRGSLAAKDGRIKVGDRVVEVNSESLLGKNSAAVIDILKKTRGVIRMVFCRLEEEE